MRKPLIATLQIAVSSALGACAVATPLAWLVARTDLPLRRVIRALVTASFVTPALPRRRSHGSCWRRPIAAC